jgi:hypothetical protein
MTTNKKFKSYDIETCAGKAGVVGLLRDVAEGDDGTSFHQRKLELELGVTADDAGVIHEDLRSVTDFIKKYERNMQQNELT